MPGPTGINQSNPVRNAQFNPPANNAGNGARAANLANFMLTLDDFRQFASGKYNAGGADQAKMTENHRRWQSLENAAPNRSEAAAIRLAFAFALEDAGVSGDRLAAACKRLGLNADFSFADGQQRTFQPLSRDEVRDVLAQSFGKPALPKSEAPRPDPFAGLGPILPENDVTEALPQQPVVPKNVHDVQEKAEIKTGNGMPKIKSEAEFKAFFKSLGTDTQYGKVSEDAEAADVNGDKKKTFTYSGIVFRIDDRRIDHPTMKTGFTSKNDLSIAKNKTEAMGLGIEFLDGDTKQPVKGLYGITGESGVSTAKTINGCIQYRHGKCSIYVIDTTKIPKEHKAWDMERTLYGNGYKVKNGDIDETKGEVNASFIPRSAIVGWVDIDDGDTFADIKANDKRLEYVQQNGTFVFNAEYAAD